MRPRDANDKLVRFGCGGAFGAFVGFWLLVDWLDQNLAASVVGLASFAVVFGLLALRFGESFWEHSGRLLSHFVGLRR